jgi:hypothetical protein
MSFNRMIPHRYLAAGLCALLLAVLAPVAASSQEGITCGMVETSVGPQFWGACPRKGPAPAPQPDVWGAVAVPSSLATRPGFSYNYRSEQGAKQGAMENCASKGGKDCKVVVTVADVCVAVAISKPERIYTVGGPIGASNVANDGAMLKCQRAGGHSCAVTTSFCADGINHTVNVDTAYSNGNAIMVAPGQASPAFGRRK